MTVLQSCNAHHAILPLMSNLQKRSSCTFTVVATMLCVSAGFSSAQTSTPPAQAFGVQLPLDYFSRFGGTSILVGSDYGWGFRDLPLPTRQDIRFTVAKRPKYWELNLYTVYQGVYLGAGLFDNGLTASTGVPRVEATYAPSSGPQWSAKWQGAGYHSKVAVGYAFTAANNRVRVLNNLGIADQAGVVAPYLHSEVSAGDSIKFTGGAVRGSTDLRLYAFPAQSKAQSSVDVRLGVNYSPTRALSVDVSHLERFAFGSVAIPDFNFARYQESAGMIMLRTPLQAQSDLAFGGYRVRATRNWTDNYTYLYNDILFSSKHLPSLLGPTIGYQWGPTSQTTMWLFGISTAPK